VGTGVGIAVTVGVGVDVGDGVVVESGHHGVGVGERFTVGSGVAVMLTQNSVISGSSPGRKSTSRHMGSVRVSSSNAQVTAPSSTVMRVVSLLTSISTCEGMLTSNTEQKGVKSSYESSCAVNKMVPARKVTCRRGKIRGFCTSMTVLGVSPSMLLSPVENCAPSTSPAIIRPVSLTAMSAPLSNVVHSESPGHCTRAFPADRRSFR
jgi:hypothetical protein